MTSATECLPPDPATPGLWWLATPADPVMRAWHPASRAWADTDGGRTAACSAHAAGWRVWVAAVPPKGADHLSDDNLCDVGPPITAEQEAFMIAWAAQVRVRNAADLLRREGQQCVPPGDTSAPDDQVLRVGQVWRCDNPRIRQRTITRIYSGQITYICPDGFGGWPIWHRELMAWAKRTGARPVPPGGAP